VLYEKETIKEHYNLIVKKDNLSYFIVTCAFDNYKILSRNEFIILNVKWKKKVKETIEFDDMGYIVNGGNVFVAVDNVRRQDFLANISQIAFTKANKSSIYTEVLELSKDEIQTFMM